MAAGKRDIEIIQSDDYTHVVHIGVLTNGTFTPTNIAGRTYTATVYDSTGVLATMTATITDAPNGEVTLTLTDAETAALAVGCYKWKLRQDASGVINTILKGQATVKPE